VQKFYNILQHFAQYALQECR